MRIRHRRRTLPTLVVFVLMAGGLGCASGSQRAWDETALRSAPSSGSEQPSYAGSPASSDGATYERFDDMSMNSSSSSESGTDDWAGEAPATSPTSLDGELVAQASPGEATPTGSGAAPPSGAGSATPMTTDATPSGRLLLIYTAVLNLAVHHVEDQQNALVEIARANDGFLARRSGSQVVIRVPAARFEAALAAAEALGDVLARTVDAQDVTEQFRDTHIRLRNLEAMRARLEELLQAADDVDEALAVERQLERVTTEIEVLRGRIRFLEDQIAYSTITVQFRARPTTQETVDEFQLPFRWLHRLGLQRLMEVR